MQVKFPGVAKQYARTVGMKETLLLRRIEMRLIRVLKSSRKCVKFGTVANTVAGYRGARY
jgi:hypothetical protein